MGWAAGAVHGAGRRGTELESPEEMVWGKTAETANTEEEHCRDQKGRAVRHGDRSSTSEEELEGDMLQVLA